MVRQVVFLSDDDVFFEVDWTIEELNARILSASEISPNEALPLNERFWENLDNIDLPGELWRQYPITPEKYRGKYRLLLKLEVSNRGRVRITDKQNNVELLPQQTWDKTNLELKDYQAFEQGQIYRLVAMTWLKDTRPENSTYWCVHHIDNTGRNNRPENLIWMSAADHGRIKHSI